VAETGLHLVSTRLPQRAPFSRPPVVLLANAGTWLNLALDSMLEPQGYRVVLASSGRELLDRVLAVGPDIILMDANFSDLDSVGVCRTLRHNPALPWNAPIIMLTSTPATKQQRLAALEAGAWDYLSVGLNAEELSLKLDAMARLKLETDRRLDESAVDSTSGLYTMRGLERRARELTADAFRRHAPLACVVLAIEPEPSGGVAATARFPVAAGYAAEILRTRGRTSDAIGGLGRGEYVVLAPATAPAGAAMMALRLSHMLETAGPRPAGLPPLRVRAGYEAVADQHATPIEPASLLEHATTALREARATGDRERIRAYRA
jgi:DNA-binding response OmpR family regulator